MSDDDMDSGPELAVATRVGATFGVEFCLRQTRASEC